MKQYDVVIGLEIHAELNTKTKVFCACKNEFGSEPNTNCCPVCVGLPGALPVLNKKAVELTIKAGLALGSEINNLAVFERKNYFYPDLSKAYQISQLVRPLCLGGGIELEKGKFVRLNRIHLEEDAGKLIHKKATIGTLVDYNRGGIPLMEIVTEPDISSAEEAVEFLTNLRRTLIYSGVANCKMEQGGMRCDVNLSVKEHGSDVLGTRTEMKNLNSFKMVKRAIEYEAKRQIEALENGEKIVQQTRKWDDNKGKSFPMRSKENSNDYRYFPDPDILTIEISKDDVASIKQTIPLLASDRQKIYMENYGLSKYDAQILTNDKFVSDYFEKCLELLNQPKQIANWIMTEVLRVLKDHETEDLATIISCQNLVDIIKAINDKKITRTNAKALFEIITTKTISGENCNALDLAKQEGMLSSFDDSALENIVQEVLTEFKDAMKDFDKSPEKVIRFYIGKVMQKSKGLANPVLTQEIILKNINK